MEKAAAQPRSPERHVWDDNILRYQTGIMVVDAIKDFDYETYQSLMELKDDNE